MGAVGAKLVGDLRRRRLQSAVIGTVVFLAATAATLALTILVESNAPFERAFDRATGAHLVLDFEGAVAPASLAATTGADTVVAASGPWPVADAVVGGRFGGSFNATEVSGRPQPEPSIDAITLTAGRWWQRPGEAVLDVSTALGIGASVGDTVTFRPLPSAPKTGSGNGPDRVPLGKLPEPQTGPGLPLTVVGIAGSVSTPDVAAWMSPNDVTTLVRDGLPRQQMLYRVDPSASEADLGAAIAAITAGLPPDAMLSSLTWLETRAGVNDTADLYVPVLLAFSIFALLAAAFTIANVVSGTVLTSYREIGVMKAVGYTPGQVSWILLAQVMAPVAVGAVAGIIVGTIASVPMVEQTARSFGLPGAFGFTPQVVIVVLVAALSITILAAIAPSIRAGRASAIAAIAHGPAPSTRPDGGRLRRLGLRLPIGLPGRLGIAAGIAHPVRALMTLGALLVGVAALTFAIGLNWSLVRVVAQIDRTAASPIRAQSVDPSLAPADVAATLAAEPGVGRSVAIGRTTASVAGLGTIPFVGYQGDASWIGFELIHGRWFTGPGEVVAPTNVFTRTGRAIGDELTVSAGGRTITVTLVGEIFDIDSESPDNLLLRGAWDDLVAVEPGLEPTAWEIQPEPGVDARSVRASLAAATDQRLSLYTIDDASTDEEFLLFLGVVGAMGIILVAVSFGGVFNTVLLETRQRTREIAVLKTVGLTPVQVVAMVVASIIPVGVVAGLLGVPLGLVFQRVVLAYMGETVGRTAIPESSLDVFGPAMLILLALAGLAIGIAGAIVPARRAAAARIAPVLQAE